MRYLSPGANPKNLTAVERDQLLAAGLSIGLVWESSASRAGQGFLAGATDARAAETEANALGLPVRCPVFYAVDFDASAGAVAPYFAGVNSVAGHPVGVYGSANVIEGVAAAFKWQTAGSRRRRTCSRGSAGRSSRAPT